MPSASDPRITVRLPQRLYDELERRGRPSTVARDLIELGVGRIEYAPDYDSKPERKKRPRKWDDVEVQREVHAKFLAMQEDSRGFRCPLPACRHQAKKPGKCPTHRGELVPVRL